MGTTLPTDPLTSPPPSKLEPIPRNHPVSTASPLRASPRLQVSYTYVQVRSDPLVEQSVRTVPLCLMSMIVAPAGVTVPDDPVA